MKVKTVAGGYEFDIDVATVYRMISAYLVFAPDKVRDIAVIESAIDLKRTLEMATSEDIKAEDPLTQDKVLKMLTEGNIQFDDDDGEIPSVP